MDSQNRTLPERRVARGFFPLVVGDDVRVERAGAVAFIARRHLGVERGGGQWLVSGGDLDIRQGGGVALVARSARVESGFLGALVAWNVNLAPEARVLLRVTSAVSAAAAAGFITGWFCGRMRSRR